MFDLQETIRYAIQTEGAEILKDKNLLLSVLEDLNPLIDEELRFLNKVYTNELGDLLYRASNDNENEIAGNVNRYLEEEFNVKTVKRISYSFSSVLKQSVSPMPKRPECFAPPCNGVILENTVANSAVNAMPNSVTNYSRHNAGNPVGPEAWFETAQRCEAGEGTDFTAAYNYQKAADAGHREAQFKTGLCYYLGKGVRKDYDKALVYFKRAADRGDILSMRYLGILFEEGGKNIKKNYQTAMNWYSKAAEKGDTEAVELYERLKKR